ncbi:ABC transporter permease [Sinorhizobium mexicanum]|uniref:ABC transporter permease n=1 Tax=Sinorhizobium mexicanum TaxID=375549 RepID=A0A859QHI9_9HYPH|nr:ABC transporter permease [Sinorhizobium mexicanum]MBP1886491.1 peptide/nickel transport system permease protein [Sinorhizobium mexicanum]QLL63934.1 ABC transporter permease [Sinorhizobium mexicanum]
MGRLVLRRMLGAVTLIAIASIFCFMLIATFPGNVALVIAEQRSATVSTAVVEQIEKEYGLRDPLLVRYGRWLGETASGNLGRSLRTNEDVASTLMQRAVPTATLIMCGGVFALFFGLTLSFLGALFPRTIIDRGTRAIALVGASMPKFFVAALLVYAFGVLLRALPTFGFDGPASWILPAVSIGIVPGALISRVTRVALEEAMARPYVTTAISKGLSRTRILIVDALPNVLPVAVNAFGIHFAYMVQAAIVIEPIFAWPGVASYFVDAARFRDYVVLQSSLLMFSIFFILVNLVVDLVVLTIDPKQRRPRRA